MTVLVTKGLYLRPARLATVADHLEEAIDEFSAWGVRIASTSRLPHMVAILRAASEAGEYPSDQGRLSLLSEAIRNAQEFVEIANSLPSQPIPSLKSDIREAVAGDLLPVSPSTGHHLQFQSQLWVGAMLAQSQARVGVLIRSGDSKNPDYILENGTLKYAVEVKRPNGELDAYNIVRKAARQIRGEQFHGGMIVVDLTDCLDVSVRHWCGTGKPEFNVANARISDLVHHLHVQVFEDGSEQLRPRREHVFGIYAFARVAYWDMSDLSYPYLVRPVGAVRYWRRNDNTLRGHRARWLTNLIGEGITTAGHRELAAPERLSGWSASA